MLSDYKEPNGIQDTYLIDGVIGEGSGGVVYLATHTRLQKKVVLKKIKSEALGAVGSRKEVDILKNLRHSYLPQVIDFIENEEGVFTVIDYIEGESIQQKLNRGYIFSEGEVRKYAEQLCEALDYLHSQNPPIIHGDIKPDNIMITRNGDICLIDFNISGYLKSGGAETFGYTAKYASPEQIEAFKKSEIATWDQGNGTITMPLGGTTKDTGGIDTRSDLYSLGYTIQVILCGNKRKIDNKISVGMQVFISKATKKKKEKRYQTAKEMFKALIFITNMEGTYHKLIVRQRYKIIEYLIAIILATTMIVMGFVKSDRFYKGGSLEILVNTLQDSVNDVINGKVVWESILIVIGVIVFGIGLISLSTAFWRFRSERFRIYKIIG